jgi:hypothetical protein
MQNQDRNAEATTLPFATLVRSVRRTSRSRATISSVPRVGSQRLRIRNVLRIIANTIARNSTAKIRPAMT